MGEEIEDDGLDGLDLERDPNVPDEVAVEVKEAIKEVNKSIGDDKKERKIYKGKKNYRGLDYVAGQEPKHREMLKMQIRGCLSWLDGEDKMSYKDMVMLPYAEFMNLLGQFGKNTGIEIDSF